jgi:hypothetical protein
VRDEWGASTFPMVPGHEIAGVVTGIGPKVTRYKMGDRVAVGCFVDSCRKCSPCLKGLEQYCVEGPTLTYYAVGRDGKNRTQGGYSNKIIVGLEYGIDCTPAPIVGGRSGMKWLEGFELRLKASSYNLKACAGSAYMVLRKPTAISTLNMVLDRIKYLLVIFDNLTLDRRFNYDNPNNQTISIRQRCIVFCNLHIFPRGLFPFIAFGNSY